MGLIDEDEDKRADDLMRQSKVKVRSRNFELWTRMVELERQIGEDNGDGSFTEHFSDLPENGSINGGGGGGGD